MVLSKSPLHHDISRRLRCPRRPCLPYQHCESRFAIRFHNQRQDKSHTPELTLSSSSLPLLASHIPNTPPTSWELNWQGKKKESANLALSRPPAIRTHSVVASPPPLSPRTLVEKPRHHVRKKSGGHGLEKERGSKRPALTTRKTAPHYIATVPSSKPRKEREEDSESFPQFWYVRISTLQQ